MLDALSSGERRVVELVSRGWTNAEVASALNVSSKTVEWTLTNVYRKLHLRSRTELALHVAKAERYPKPGVNKTGGAEAPPVSSTSRAARN